MIVVGPVCDEDAGLVFHVGERVATNKCTSRSRARGIWMESFIRRIFLITGNSEVHVLRHIVNRRVGDFFSVLLPVSSTLFAWGVREAEQTNA